MTSQVTALDGFMGAHDLCGPHHTVDTPDGAAVRAPNGNGDAADRTGDINDRFVILVDRYRDIKEKSNLLKVRFCTCFVPVTVCGDGTD